MDANAVSELLINLCYLIYNQRSQLEWEGGGTGGANKVPSH